MPDENPQSNKVPEQPAPAEGGGHGGVDRGASRHIGPCERRVGRLTDTEDRSL